MDLDCPLQLRAEAALRHGLGMRAAEREGGGERIEPGPALRDRPPLGPGLAVLGDGEAPSLEADLRGQGSAPDGAARQVEAGHAGQAARVGPAQARRLLAVGPGRDLGDDCLAIGPGLGEGGLRRAVDAVLEQACDHPAAAAQAHHPPAAPAGVRLLPFEGVEIVVPRRAECLMRGERRTGARKRNGMPGSAPGLSAHGVWPGCHRCRRLGTAFAHAADVLQADRVTRPARLPRPSQFVTRSVSLSIPRAPSEASKFNIQSTLRHRKSDDGTIRLFCSRFDLL